MAGKSDIRAGGAFVELRTKDTDFQRGMKAATATLRNFGSQVASVRAFFAGLGTAILAPLGAAVMHFSAAGSVLADMSARTGVAADKLAELKFAAEQTGTSLEDVEKALRYMAKNGMNVNNFDAVAASIAAI